MQLQMEYFLWITTQISIYKLCQFLIIKSFHSQNYNINKSQSTPFLCGGKNSYTHSTILYSFSRSNTHLTVTFYTRSTFFHGADSLLWNWCMTIDWDATLKPDFLIGRSHQNSDLLLNVDDHCQWVIYQLFWLDQCRFWGKTLYYPYVPLSYPV